MTATISPIAAPVLGPAGMTKIRRYQGLCAARDLVNAHGLDTAVLADAAFALDHEIDNLGADIAQTLIAVALRKQNPTAKFASSHRKAAMMIAEDPALVVGALHAAGVLA